MPINRLASNRPSVLSTQNASAAASSRNAANTNFQGRKVSLAGQRQSTHFLETNDSLQHFNVLPQTSKSINRRNVAVAQANQNRLSQDSGFEEMATPSDDYEEMGMPPANDYEEIGMPPSDDYEEIGMTPSDDYEEIGMPPSDDYEEIGMPPSDDYEEIGMPPSDDYEEMGMPPSDDYEEMGMPPSDDYEEMGMLPSDDYEEMGMPPSDDYEEMGMPPSDDYEEMGMPPSDDYKEIEAHQYEELPANSSHPTNSPTGSAYMKMRSVVDSSATDRMNKSDLLRMKQLSGECKDYLKELDSDLQKVMQCAKNPQTVSKDDMVALKQFVIPQHINCISNYTQAVHTLLKPGRYAAGQRPYLEKSEHQLNTMRAKLLEAQGIIGDAIQADNFSAENASNLVNLNHEQTSVAGQLMKTQSEILSIHRSVGDISMKVNELVFRSPVQWQRGAEGLRQIADCKRELVALKAKLPQCIVSIKNVMDAVNSYEALIRERPEIVGEQPLRERRYPMNLSRKLEHQLRNINTAISDGLNRLSQLT